MKTIGCLAFLTVFSASAAQAEEQTVRDQISECFAAHRSSDTDAANRAALAIASIKEISDLRDRMDAATCMHQVTGESWAYFPEVGRMLPTAIRKALSNSANFRAEAKHAFETLNASKIAEDTYVACTKLYEEQPLATMTNQICHASFSANGHPSLSSRQDFIVEYQKSRLAPILSQLSPTARELLEEHWAELMSR